MHLANAPKAGATLQESDVRLFFDPRLEPRVKNLQKFLFGQVLVSLLRQIPK
jgi:hypothetical protein